MKQLKKTLLTLALLITVATGAMAQEKITTIPNGDFETWTYDGEDMPNNWNSNATSDGSLNGFYGGKQLKRSTDVRPGSSGQYSCSIWSKSVMGVTNIGILTSGRIHFGAASSTSNANYIYSDRDGSNTKNNVTNPCAMPFTGKPTAVKVWVKYVQGGTGYGQYATAKFSAIIHGDADYVAYNLAEDDNDDNKALVVASAEQEIAYNNGEWEQLTIPFNYTDNNVVPAYILINAYTNAYPGKGRANDYLYIDDIELEYASASSGPKVAWDKAKNSGTFTMPGGNVTLEPEYYPQAALTTQPTAIDNVPATTDGAIVNAGTVANIGETTNAQGTVMYYVSPSPLDDAALQALAADQWTADVPTAADLAQGQAHVYYYVRGNDSDNDDENFSDGDILAANALTVTIAAEPTYAVTFADGVNPEPPAEPEWTASPAADVKKGQTVTVTYSGTKKVIGVKAEKKAATPSLNITSPVVGQVIGSDGKNYAYGSLPSGVTAVAKICYVSGSNGLALALTDEDGTMNWSTAQTTCAAHTPAFIGGTWKLATQDEWNSMISAAGSDTALRDGFSSVGGKNMQSNAYWSSTGSGSYFAWYYFFNYSYWNDDDKDRSVCVRAVLEF